MAKEALDCSHHFSPFGRCFVASLEDKIPQVAQRVTTAVKSEKEQNDKRSGSQQVPRRR